MNILKKLVNEKNQISIKIRLYFLVMVLLTFWIKLNENRSF